TGHIDHDFRLRTLALEFLADEFPQFVDRKFRSVDDQVGHGANRRELLPLGEDAPADRLVSAARMPPPGLAEAAHDRGVIGFQDHQPRLQEAPDPAVDLGEALEALAFTNVDYQSGGANA